MKPDEMSKYSFTQLRLLAQRRKIKGYSRMTKEELYHVLFDEQKTRPAQTVKKQPSTMDDERMRRRRSW